MARVTMPVSSFGYPAISRIRLRKSFGRDPLTIYETGFVTVTPSSGYFLDSRVP
jgi:hypothetical protein